jgi:ubiquinone/menaquinone biosynthesis C-methylase UbiE
MKLGELVYFTLSNKKKVDNLQKNIRNIEWAAISNYIKLNSDFLDVGCGTGYALQKAKEDKNCNVFGIDPEPGSHGVGRYNKEVKMSSFIQKAYSEKIPFEDNSFDVVYSSHVLEHVSDEIQSLKEMKRVLKEDGVLILGMPTATMAYISLFSRIIFTTHVRFYIFLRNLYKLSFAKNIYQFIHIPSHSTPRASSIFYDLKHYKISNWKRIVQQEFEIQQIILPALYPYPDFPQFFKLKKFKRFSSSVFFICKK